jgi:hypothetical protein
MHHSLAQCPDLDRNSIECDEKGKNSLLDNITSTKCAPVLLSVYNRTRHFKDCLNSLSECKGAENTVVYISSDAAAQESDKQKVEEIREFILNFSGFKEIIPVFSEQNTKGKIIKQAYKLVFESHDRLIRSEDDNVFSKDFLTFVNRGLDLYKDRPDVFSVSGYNSPITMPDWYKEVLYLRPTYTGWGVGLWKEKWEMVEWSIDNFKSMYRNPANRKRIDKEHAVVIPILNTIRDTGKILGDGLVFLYMLDKNLYSIYPVESRVRNMGHDGSGVNCGFSDEYSNQELFTGKDNYEMPEDLKPDTKLIEFVLSQYKDQPLLRLKRLLKPFFIKYLPFIK